jgi:hypothetical protein
MTSTSIEISFIPDDDHIDEALLIFASPSADPGDGGLAGSCDPSLQKEVLVTIVPSGT